MAGGEQHGERFRAVNPQGVLPALALDDGPGAVLFQSLAIIEYLDETHPAPPLLPAGRARVRGLAQTHAADVAFAAAHPLKQPGAPPALNHVRGCQVPSVRATAICPMNAGACSGSSQRTTITASCFGSIHT